MDIRFFVLAIIVFFLAALLANSLIHLYKRKQQGERHIQTVEDKVVKLRRENEEMETVLRQTATPSFIEKEIRRRFNMKKPGEKLVIIVPSTGMKHETQNMKQIEEEILPKSPKSVWEWFKKLFRP